MAQQSKKGTDRKSSNLTGVAGEYFVAAELSRRGFIASISLRNTRGIDILATNADASKTVTIQCKTNQLGKKAWVMNEKAENFESQDHFYVFVMLSALDKQPTYHIVPSKAVAQYVRDSHQRWLDTPGRDGRPHVDNSVRQFKDQDNQYLGQWDLLGL